MKESLKGCMVVSTDLNHTKQTLIGSEKLGQKMIGLDVSIETDSTGKWLSCNEQKTNRTGSRKMSDYKLS